MSQARALIWVQHLLGIGHLRRAASLARALAERDFDVLLVSGGMPLKGLDLGAAKFEQLPPLRATDASFSTLADAGGDRERDHLCVAVRTGLRAPGALVRPGSPPRLVHRTRFDSEAATHRQGALSGRRRRLCPHARPRALRECLSPSRERDERHTGAGL